jgi:uncharacterized lipoprotein YmbA
MTNAIKTKMIDIPQMPHKMDTPSTTDSTTLLLGHAGSWWDFWMIFSLAAAAFIAVFIVVFTAGSVIVHKREASAAAEELERYKLATAGQVSEANERAAVARLKTEQLKKEVAWRELDPQIAHSLVAELSKSPSSVTLVYVPDDPEATQYCVQFRNVFAAAKWKIEVAGRRFLGPPTGIVVTHNDRWSLDIQAEIDRVRSAFVRAGVPIEDGGGAVEARVPGLSSGSATASVRVVIGSRPPPKLE